MPDIDRMKCPNCGADGDEITYWISGLKGEKHFFEWKCHECGNEWETDMDGNIVEDENLNLKEGGE